MYLYFSIISLIIITTVNSDVFTAIADMEGLLNIENIMITNLQTYLFDQAKVLNIVRK